MPGLSQSCLSLAAAMFMVAACSDVRDRSGSDGYHPTGWATTGATEFHGVWLADNGHELGTCRTCHGDDDRGGDVAVSCESSNCHTEGVDACGTCHGTFASNPLPQTGAHTAHPNLCTSCHPVPAGVDSAGHLDGNADVAFAEVAVAGGATPSFDSATGTCTDSYCHGPTTLSWTQPPSLDCTGCHGEPPSSHSGFARVAGPGTCTSCHPDSDGDAHVDGDVDLLTTRCDQCHGQTNRSSPPVALDGSTAANSRGVGAHRRHTDETLVGRIGKTSRCDQCHVVPESTTSAGHIDTSAGAEVVLPRAGGYASADQTCRVWCHWDRDPGPRWTDDSGAARACDACHDFPLSQTRAGTPHPTSPPDVTVGECLTCHVLSPATHVNGTVDFAF